MAGSDSCGKGEVRFRRELRVDPKLAREIEDMDPEERERLGREVADRLRKRMRQDWERMLERHLYGGSSFTVPAPVGLMAASRLERRQVKP